MADLPHKPRRAGLSHLLAALRYSAAGLRRLWREAAFRQEVAFGIGGIAVIALSGGSAARCLGFAVLLLVLVALEALNTAIETLVDHLSPGWAEFARDAKDLGSLAVACIVGAMGLYLLWAVFL